MRYITYEILMLDALGTQDAIIGFNYIIVNQIIAKNLIFTVGIRREGEFSIIGATNLTYQHVIYHDFSYTLTTYNLYRTLHHVFRNHLLF